MRIVTCMLAASIMVCAPALAQAKVRILVDLDAQTMHVEAKDRTFDWKVSSGKSGYDTPPGTYGVLWMDKDHLSDEYNKVPMPNAIFFKPGFAIHGASKSAFGHPASHGCVRLPIAKSAILFDLVKAEGAEVKIVGAEVPPDVQARRDAEKRDRQATEAGYSEPASANAPYGYDEDPGFRRPQQEPQQRDLFGSVYTEGG